MKQSINVAFICVHNSCRSQIAETLAKCILPDYCAIYSAGTELKSQINQDAVRLMKDRYGIDMEATQEPKLISTLPTPIDYVITMGCGVTCPNLPHHYMEDWGLPDPSGQSDEVFMQVIMQIQEKMKQLKNQIEKKYHE